MNIVLLSSLIICIFIIAALIFKIISMQRSLDEISKRIEEISCESTNILIDVSSQDKHLKKLAKTLNREFKTMRYAYTKDTNGDKELKDSITNISHDIRTPLTSICGYLDMLKDEDMSDDAKRYVDIIYNRACDMKTLTDEFFKYSLTINKGKLDIKNVDVKSVLEDTVLSFYGMLQKNNIDIFLSFCECEVIRQLNESLLTRIFENIIHHAIKYTDGDLMITLTDKCNITFKNSAIWLREIDVLKLFNKFFTVNNAKHSTGLGLSIAKQLTEKMNGNINAYYKDNNLFITLKF